MSEPLWRRMMLLMALFVLGGLYILAFAFFLAESHDFIAARHNANALTHALANPIAVPTSLIFSTGNSSSALLGSGWYAIEPNGVWSMDDAWIALATRQTEAGIKVKMNTIAFIGRRHKKIVVTADIDGRPLGKWIREKNNQSQAIDFCIPLEISRSQHMLLHLRINPIASPFEVGTGPDERRLGILLTSLDLTQGCESDHESVTH